MLANNTNNETTTNRHYTMTDNDPMAASNNNMKAASNNDMTADSTNNNMADSSYTLTNNDMMVDSRGLSLEIFEKPHDSKQASFAKTYQAKAKSGSMA